ncbi:glycosyltransferase [Pedobacter caeni]|uniref:Glycosyl transferase family 2 n=1 Tax=Pedobacter caeni TaxID=288992 RepID=A0A1M5H2Q9_9SPHI|nr:glycosyltransferase [Pedobacter caeni]SHG10299.1 Glycosyl transferase family 2 [Pedobacter caeni]
MENSAPLISCICITNNSPLSLQRSLACFETQDYPNKELIISYPKNDYLTRFIVDQITSISDITISRIEHSENENLEITRKNILAIASGDFLCTWNPNSWHNTNRLSLQYEAIKNTQFIASILTHITLFDIKSKQAYFSNHFIFEETLLFDKRTLRWKESSSGYLSDNNLLFHIKNSPYSYIYIISDTNRNNERESSPILSELPTADETTNQEIYEITSLEFYRL